MQENFSSIIKPQISLGRLFFRRQSIFAECTHDNGVILLNWSENSTLMFHFLVDSVPVGPLQNESIPRSSLKRSPRVDNFVQNHYRSFILTLNPGILFLQWISYQYTGCFFLTDLKNQEVERVLSRCNTITSWLTAKNSYTQYHWIRVYMFDIICGRSYDNISCYRPQTKFGVR